MPSSLDLGERNVSAMGGVALSVPKPAVPLGHGDRRVAGDLCDGPKIRPVGEQPPDHFVAEPVRADTSCRCRRGTS